MNFMLVNCRHTNFGEIFKRLAQSNYLRHIWNTWFKLARCWSRIVAAIDERGEPGQEKGQGTLPA